MIVSKGKFIRLLAISKALTGENQFKQTTGSFDERFLS